MRLIAIVVLVACGKSSEPAKPETIDRRRMTEHDEWCEDKAKPAAYYFGSQTDAEAAGCKLRRVHRQTERDGQMLDDEVIVFCCSS